jgi:hypothetical protein
MLPRRTAEGNRGDATRQHFVSAAIGVFVRGVPRWLPIRLNLGVHAAIKKALHPNVNKLVVHQSCAGRPPAGSAKTTP